MKKIFLVITSIAKDSNSVLKQFARESSVNKIPFIVIGDTKSPNKFNLKGCDFYSIDSQLNLNFKLAKILPVNHYARKNLGYLIAMKQGADIIIETDDDNIPFLDFWNKRKKEVRAHKISNSNWVNIYKYFTDINIWPRGFALENIYDDLPKLGKQELVNCPIQQGLSDNNPDVDALYRLIFPLPVVFNKSNSIALGEESICPFNSQNTTWFKEAYQLLYLPSFCSFRMTDIWRSFVAQRIAWTCGWSILFHKSNVYQERNVHNLLNDFKDEIIGYVNNAEIYKELKELNLKPGVKNIDFNMILCYKKLIELGVINKAELSLLEAWLEDIDFLKQNPLN